MSVIRDCFIEIIDLDIIDIWEDENKVGMEIVLPEMKKDRISDFNNIVQHEKRRVSILEDVEVAILRIKDEVPQLSMNIYPEEGGLQIYFFETKPEEGQFYTKRERIVTLSPVAIRDILVLDKDVKIGVWRGSSGQQTLKIEFRNKRHFEEHMYREFVDRRDNMPGARTGFENEGVSDALIISPEYMERYRKLGNNFDKLKIDGENIVKKIVAVEYSGSQETIYINGVQTTRPVWYVSLLLDNKWKYTI